MESTKPTDQLLPPALLAEVEVMALAEHRPAREMLREAVERYLYEHRPFAGVNATRPAVKRSAEEAGAHA